MPQILIVDDEEPIREVLIEFLTGLAYSAVGVDSGARALDLGAFDFIQKPLDLEYLERTLLAKFVTLEEAGNSALPGRTPDGSSHRASR